VFERGKEMAKMPEPRYSEEWEVTQKARFDAILGRDLAKLLRESSQEFNFLEIKAKVEFVINQVDIISKNFDFWQQLSDSRQNALNSSLDDIKTAFGEMETFDPKQNNAWELRNSTVQSFSNRYNAFYDSVVSPLGSFLGKKAYSEELAGKFGQQAEQELAEIRRVKKEIEKVQVDVKEAAEIAGDIASSAHSAAFSEDAVKHATSADKWLKAVIIFGIVAMLLAITVLYDIFKELINDDYKSGGESYVIKIAILAFIYIGVRFTIKNFSAHQHLNIVNKHRANVLSSMEAFRTSAIDEPTKDAILLAGVGAAYSQQESGFITTKEGAGSDDGDVMSIVKSVVDKP
jgi:hypothetical protein